MSTRNNMVICILFHDSRIFAIPLAPTWNDELIPYFYDFLITENIIKIDDVIEYIGISRDSRRITYIENEHKCTCDKEKSITDQKTDSLFYLEITMTTDIIKIVKVNSNPGYNMSKILKLIHSLLSIEGISYGILKIKKGTT